MTDPVTQSSASPVDTIEGELASIPYVDTDSGWSILQLSCEGDIIEANGIVEGVLHIGELLKVTGRLLPSPSFGAKEMEFDHLISRPPRTIPALTQYISSVCGFNLGDADLLTSEFGIAITDILDRDPARIADVIDDTATVT